MNEQRSPKSSELYHHYLSHHFGLGASSASRRRRIDSLACNYGNHLPDHRGAQILEIGPGLGELLEYLCHNRGYTAVSAIDLSAEVAERCNLVVPGSTEVVRDSVAFLESNAGRFELIFAFHLLEHIPKPEIVRFLQAIRAALAPGGRVFIEVPNMANPLVGLNIRYADFTHEVGFTESSLSFALRSAGFSEVSVFGIRIARNSVSKIIQSAAQATVNLLLRLMIRVYLPTQRQLLHIAICGVARK